MWLTASAGERLVDDFLMMASSPATTPGRLDL
jgi:hypothetical protein